MPNKAKAAVKSETKLCDKVKNLIYSINHMLIAFNTLYLTWHCLQAGFEKSTSRHALLTTVGVSFQSFNCFDVFVFNIRI